MKDDLPTLARRVEMGDASRELDAAIWCALHPGWTPTDGAAVNGYCVPPPDFWQNGRQAPRYLTSRDAAASLAIEGWWMTLIAGQNGARCRLNYVYPHGRMGRPEISVEGVAPTEPRAVTAAWLRARAVEREAGR